MFLLTIACFSEMMHPFLHVIPCGGEKLSGRKFFGFRLPPQQNYLGTQSFKAPQNYSRGIKYYYLAGIGRTTPWNKELGVCFLLKASGIFCIDVFCWYRPKTNCFHFHFRF